jgi:hypothetical protein
MPFKLATTARNAACDGIVDLIDAGAGAGLIRIYQGTQPADPQTAHASVLLATLTFTDPAFGAAATGVATASAITSDTNVDATGTAQWARVVDSDGVDPTDAVFDMDIGQGSGTLNFDNTAFVATGTAAISSMTVTVPES